MQLWQQLGLLFGATALFTGAAVAVVIQFDRLSTKHKCPHWMIDTLTVFTVLCVIGACACVVYAIV